MTLTPQFLDELRSRTLLSTLIGRTTKLQKAGREWRACCPFHNEKSPSFYVNDDKAFYHCLAGETMVITREGTRRIDSLDGTCTTVLSRNGQWIDSSFRCYGTQRLWKIDLTRNGLKKSVWATDGHRWFVNGRASEVVTADLKKNHALESALPPRRHNWQLDPEGVRHGIIFGDGTMYQGVYGTINLHGAKDAELASWFPDQQHHRHERAPGKHYLRVYGGRAFEAMKQLPDMSMPDAYLLGFIAGYLAADGHVAKDGTVMLNSADPAALDAVRDIALRVGIATYGRTTLMRKGFGTAPSALHRIHFVSSTLDPALFLLAEARSRFSGHSKAFDRLRWVVSSVEQSDRVEPVFCAEVPGEHAFALEDNILTGNCFGCGAHGDAIRWMTEQRGLPFIDAVKELVQAAGMEMPALDARAAEKAERAKGLHEVCADAATWFTEQLNGIAGAEACAVLEKRGIRAETAKTFSLGFAPDSRGKLRTALKEYGDAMLVESGMLIKVDDKEPYDRFRGRLMIPIRDPRGRVIAFGGRVIGDGEPKYLNSPETPLFDKGRNLYNLDRAAPASRKSGRLLVVEGYMDVIALAQAGFGEAVAPLGTALTEAQLERLWRLVDVPILCFDGDSAGQKAAIRAAQRAMPMLAPGRSLSFVTLPAGQDPDDLVRAKGPGAFEALLKEPESLVARLWAHEVAAEPLDTPEQKAGLKQRLGELAASIADANVRQEYLADFRRRFDDLYAKKRTPYVERKPQRNAQKNGRWAPPVPIGGNHPAAQGIRAGGIDRVLAKAVLAGLINHPTEIARHMDVLDRLKQADGALGQLFKAVVDFAIEEQALDSARLVTILASSGFDDVTGDLLRADRATFAPKGADEARARADLDEAIHILVSRPEIDAELAEATAALMRNYTDEAFERQVSLVKDKQALDARLANLVQSDEDARALGTEGS
ncbi:DNA primase [Sphingomonas sp. AR_OL41]|uniref:DNA primase n=1 Tax=Sphingomonas sp. AR_OL41 TaxID=3042729 RepID=UPI002480C08E|nr:DNA primase [Sphingomonas sp. AR_OL41]MDH7973165.1 DNA primase [Sphingomonas sp. AR_OL41]